MNTVTATSVLVVEDDQDIARLLNYHLVNWGYEVTLAATATEGLKALEKHVPKIILLDWRLPKSTSGLDLLRIIRKREAWLHIPVLMLTARTAVDDRIRGLEAGGDDYLCKPFSVRELKARMQALLRRTTLDNTDSAPLKAGGFILNSAEGSLQMKGGEAVAIGKPETLIMQALLNNKEAVVSRQQLARIMRANNLEYSSRNLNVYISRLRKVMGDSAHQLKTLRDRGYRLML